MPFEKISNEQLAFQFFESKGDISQQEISPLPMQYLGGKTRIAVWILQHVRNVFPNTPIFFDLFAGTGAVSYVAAMFDYRVYANDIQPYSFYVLKSLLSTPRKGLPALIRKVRELKDDHILTSGSRNEAYELLQTEDNFLRDYAFSWKRYRDFCDETPRILGTAEEVNNLRLQNGWNLFTKYYPNTYFGVRQCLQIDAIRELAETLGESLKVHLLAAAVSVMTHSVSSTTHLAQFLKPTNKVRSEKLLRKRSINIIDEVCSRLEALNRRFCFPQKGKVTNLDFRAALRTTNVDSSWVIYVDPPYFKEHYSRYYHVLDTFILYDYPEISINPQTGTRSVGLYRKERFISEFGLKSSVTNAFADLFQYCIERGANLAVSYANTSLLPIEHIMTISQEKQFQAKIEKISLMHSGQGQPRNRNVTEYLVLLKPDEHIVRQNKNPKR